MSDTNWRPLEGSQALRLTSFTLVALFVSGCPRPALPPVMPPATSMAIAVKQEKKDETVLGAAERIEKNNAEADQTGVALRGGQSALHERDGNVCARVRQQPEIFY